MKEMPDNSVDCVITDPPYPTISGGSGPLVSAGKAYKTNKTSPFKIRLRLRVKED